jgi:hypothetical protein
MDPETFAFDTMGLSREELKKLIFEEIMNF